MLGLDILDLTNTLTESGLVDFTLEELIGTTQYFIVGQNPNVQSSLKKHVARWKEYIRFRMTHVSQTDRFQTEMALYREVIHWEEAVFRQEINQVVDQLEGVSVFYNDAKRLLSDEYNIHNPMFPQYFCELWYQCIEAEVSQALSTELEAEKKD